MNLSKISIRYAKALFILSQEKNVLEQIKDDIVLIQETCKLADFNTLIESPVIRTSQKDKTIKNIFEGKINDISLSFLSLIVKNKRESYINDITRNFLNQYRKQKGIKSATFTSAANLDEETKKNVIDIIKKIFKTEVELNNVTNKDLIGGFILRVDDKQIDASIATKLKNLNKDLLNTPIE